MLRWILSAVLSASLALSPALGGTTMLLGAGTGAPVAGGGGGGSVSWTPTDSRAQFDSQFAGFQSLFDTVAIGTAAANRVVVISVFADAVGGAVAGVSVGSTNLTKDVEDNTGLNGLPWISIWSGVVATGTSATVTVTKTSTWPNDVGIFAGALITNTAAHSATAIFTEAVTTTPSVSIAIPSGGIALTLLTTDRTVTGSWSNSTQDYHIVDARSFDELLAHSTATGTVVPTWTGTNSNYGMISTAWGP